MLFTYLDGTSLHYVSSFEEECNVYFSHILIVTVQQQVSLRDCRQKRRAEALICFKGVILV